MMGWGVYKRYFDLGPTTTADIYEVRYFVKILFFLV